MIAINWGSSNFRAYKLDAQGNVEDEKASGRGAVGVPSGGFLDALILEVGDWLFGTDPRVLMSGMVGARRGWKEAPYVPVPGTFEQVVKGVIRLDVEGLDVRIVPGLIGKDEQGIPEVLRGEETEIFGCTTDLGKYMLLCLPGTHTKWVRMEEGKIVGFMTSMTGDIFKAIREHTILRACTQQEPTDEEAFLRGVERARQPGDIAHHLFGVRTLVLTGAMQESSASSYLSGLLIGHEVRAMAWQDDAVLLIGDPVLCSLYEKALRKIDVNSTVEPEGAALRGLKRITEGIKW
jgi:2-dehydro-3-deoxygalactonokinase